MSIAAFTRFVRLPSARLRMSWIALALATMMSLGEVPVEAAPSDLQALIEGRGRDVHFPVSCGESVQPLFDAALAALHSFWYGQSLKEFTAIVESNPDCAMAHWGIAMSVCGFIHQTHIFKSAI
jgi:hypothetical protein